MNKEVKEYLDSANFKFKDVDEDGNEIELTLSEEIENLVENNKKLADYITNLQQDNEMYAQLKDEYEEEIKDLQQEKQRLEENNQNMQEEMCRSWQRIDKAIEYIKNYMPYLQETDKEYEDMEGNTYFTYKKWDDTDLLNILQNGDNKDD